MINAALLLGELIMDADEVLDFYNSGIEKGRLHANIGLIEFARTKEILMDLLPQPRLLFMISAEDTVNMPGIWRRLAIGYIFLIFLRQISVWLKIFQLYIPE